MFLQEQFVTASQYATIFFLTLSLPSGEAPCLDKKLIIPKNYQPGICAIKLVIFSNIHYKMPVQSAPNKIITVKKTATDVSQLVQVLNYFHPVSEGIEQYF